jgi:hypothetical protein
MATRRHRHEPGARFLVLAVSILRTLLARARALRRSADAERDLDDELRAFVEARAAAHERRGLAPAEAKRAALIDVGGVDQVKERVRDVRIGSALEAAARDAIRSPSALAISWLCHRRHHDHRPWHRGERRDLQRGARGALAIAALPGRWPHRCRRGRHRGPARRRGSQRRRPTTFGAGSEHSALLAKRRSRGHNRRSACSRASCQATSV